ncbi:hypothetical protein NKR23_g9589 [Pleurostoma richardsiae]|uniref:Uncharacterized protein n=1 Tax=Pleurostoma richardsiae TaxID=41990 RepID=A0AA38REX1_9PEZI|nr:hypothetical protein NKR23_g9589 [Pleurostoma richardsiae]
MAPSNDELRRIAAEAEQDLNSPQAKNIGRRTGLDDAGVDSQVERKFPGAEVSYQPDLSTNAGYDRRIPPSEGGDLDARGRQARGHQYEGAGGPYDKEDLRQRDRGGDDDRDALPKEILGAGNQSASGTNWGKDILEQGSSATRNNIRDNPSGPGGGKFRGDEYYQAEDVPDSTAAEGYIPPESVTQASRESEY